MKQWPWLCTRILVALAVLSLAISNAWAYWPTPAPTLPAKGGKLTDPSFGTTVMRVTDSSDNGNFSTAYSYWPTFSKNNGHIVLYNLDTSIGYVYDFNPTTFQLVGSKRLLFATNPPGGGSPEWDDPIWSGLNDDLMYGHEGLRIWHYNVNTQAWTQVADLSGRLLAGAAHLRQWSKSVNDDVFGFSIQNASWGYIGYGAYKKSTNQVLLSVSNASFDEVQVDKSGRYLVAKMNDGTVTVYDLQLSTNTTLTDGAPDFAPGHSDNGTSVCLGCDNWNNQYTYRDLATPHSFSVVYNWGSNWGHDEHISYHLDDEAWVALSTYETATPPNNTLRSEILLMRTDGSGEVQHLCHHYSHYNDYYDSPRANVSRDGRYIAFTSNWGNSGRLDLFIVQVPAVAPQPPVASFSGNPTTGSAPLAVAFTDLSTNGPTAWSWSFGDSGTSTAQHPSHSYASAGDYTVSLTASNAAGSDGETKTNYISVSGSGGSAPTLVAAGTVASGTGAITPALPAGLQTNDILLLFVETANQAVSIANQNGGAWTQAGSPQGYGTGGASNATRLTIFWSRYNGSQGAPTTSDSGNHQAGRIIAVRGCVASGDPCDVIAGGAESTVDTSGSIPGATTTMANTLVVAALATSLPDTNGTSNFSAWSNASLTSLTERTDNTRAAGNGGGVAVATGTKATAGAYGATAVTTGTAATKALVSLALKPGGGGGSAPVASFTGSPTSGAAPLAVSFTDTSTNSPTSWSWTFGDGGTSTAQNPGHTYAAGTYAVSLTASNAYGSDGETKTNYITASGATEVYVYPDAWNWHSNGVGALIAGGLSEVQTSNNSYMQVRCNASNHNSGLRYEFHTGYTPAQVNKVTVEYEFHGTRTDQPWYQCLILKQDGSGGNTAMGGGLWTTTDQSLTWESTAVSTYMSSTGYLHMTVCGCSQNANNYDTYVDVVRVKLTLN